VATPASHPGEAARGLRAGSTVPDASPKPMRGRRGAYAEATVSRFPAILAVFAGYVVPAIFGLPAELMLFDSVINQLFPGLMPNMGWALSLLGILVVLDLAGTDVFATTQQILTFVIISFFLVVGLYVTGRFHTGARPAAQVWQGFTVHTAIAPVAVLCSWTLIGCEYVTPMVEAARDARRDLPRAMRDLRPRGGDLGQVFHETAVVRGRHQACLTHLGGRFPARFRPASGRPRNWPSSRGRAPSRNGPSRCPRGPRSC